MNLNLRPKEECTFDEISLGKAAENITWQEDFAVASV